jgi:predicted RNase H-like nuclease
MKLFNYILQVLPTQEPALSSLSLGERFIPDLPYTGKALKETEDKLDSLICAYVGAYWWFWGTQRNQVLGDLDTGYIVIPQRELLSPSN